MGWARDIERQESARDRLAPAKSAAEQAEFIRRFVEASGRGDAIQAERDAAAAIENLKRTASDAGYEVADDGTDG